MRRGRRGRRVSGGRCSAAAVPLGTSLPPPTDAHGGPRSRRVAVASGVRACWLGVVVVRGGARASSKRRESRYFYQALRRKARPTHGWMRWASGPCARTHRVMLTHRPKLMSIEWRKLRIRYACGSVKYQILIFRVCIFNFESKRAISGSGGVRWWLQRSNAGVILAARVQRATNSPGVGAGASSGRSPDAQREALSADVYITNAF